MTGQAVIPERLTTIEHLELASGNHPPPKGPDDVQACVMEAVAYVAGEPWSDHPECASPILTSFLIAWNDRLDDESRQILKPYIPRLVGTNTGEADEATRRYMLTEWIVREAMPGLLQQANMTADAILLEQLVTITDEPTYDTAREALDGIYDAAWEIRRGWRERIRQAARDEFAKQGKPAEVAAVAAAEVAAVAAANYYTTYDAAYNAAYPIFKAAFDEKLGDITGGLRASALLLLDRLIDVGKTTETQAA